MGLDEGAFMEVAAMSQESSFHSSQMDFAIDITEEWSYWWCVFFAVLTYATTGLMSLLTVVWMGTFKYGDITEHSYDTASSPYFMTFASCLLINMVHLLAVAFRVQLTEHSSIGVSNGVLTFTNHKGRPCTAGWTVPVETVQYLEVEPKCLNITAQGQTFSVPLRTPVKAQYLHAVLDTVLQNQAAFAQNMMVSYKVLHLCLLTRS